MSTKHTFTILCLLAAVAVSKLFLASCQPTPPEPTATLAIIPTPVLWHVQHTSSLRWMTPLMNQCTQEQQDNTALITSEISAPHLDPNEADFLLYWGEPDKPAGYAATVGWDELAVIVHPANTISHLELDGLRAIYSGSVLSWRELDELSPIKGDIKVWSYAENEDVQQNLEALLALRTITPRAYLAPDPEAMLEAISRDPAAIGFLPLRSIDASVRTVEAVDASVQALSFPIILISPTEPQGAQREWALCLQDNLSD